MRRLRRLSITVALSLFLLSMGNGALHLSPIERAAAPYLYDLFTWEISHLPDKWLYKLWDLMPWNSRSRDERLKELLEFFEIEAQIKPLEQDLAKLGALTASPHGNPGTGGTTHSVEGDEALLERLDHLRRKRSKMKPGVEETLESEVSAILSQEGLSWRIGLIFPPVDVALSSPPRVLVVSPRDRIDRIKTVLLKPNMKVEAMEELEERIFREQNLAALVEDIGGVATYPTIVEEDASLRHAANLAAHEWLHTYWFFRPLGWNFWSSDQMTTLNETAADLAGRELGKRVYAAITGERLPEPPPGELRSSGEARAPLPPREPDGGGFDFGQEMRTTRLRVDELLVQERIEEAEGYMEERRKLFVENGFFIRKLNQAFFAFHGTYAASPASVSPIGGEVERVRSATESIGEFIRTMAGFGSYGEFREYLSALSDTRPLKQTLRQLPIQLLEEPQPAGP